MSVKRPRVSRNEQVFFNDPAIDRLMGVVMALASEHYVLFERVRLLEHEMAKRGIAVNDGVRTDDDVASPRADAESDAAAFAEALLLPLLGLQDATGPSGAFSLKRAGPGRKDA